MLCHVFCMVEPALIERVRRKFQRLQSVLDERGRRHWAACEALELGHGGIRAVAQATGLGERTIQRGCEEMRGEEASDPSPAGRIRRSGGGRHAVTAQDPKLLEALEALVEPSARGDPMSPLRWTCKSTRKLAEALARQGHGVSHSKVAQLLKQLDYRLQGTRKCLEGNSHPDRDAQFRYINRCVRVFQRAGQPVISVDAKKKELVGPFANRGREYRPKGQPEPVRTHDFADKALGKVCPYGIYDLTDNRGWVSVGVDHDTAQFAVASIRRWWARMGHQCYPHAQSLLITADGGGSNASRNRLWKVELQKLADELGLAIYVRHFPPGTSKWNKIEHRMFCHITENWRGRPLINHEVIVNLIANTTTTQGLEIRAELDEAGYPTGISVSDDEFRAVNLVPARFHGMDWNYLIKPRSDHRKSATY
ncbi:DDE family transposase [Thiocapsa rosea]|uniref:DDE family transposase n=1 Tax=Thiocapsa rosea TaxID=69360 RepID=A0A495VDX9_9GAMM|nr:DDE family transposase [Thiocapsa rosea]